MGDRKNQGEGGDDVVVLDLFGDPVPLNRGGKGRPAHVATAENRAKVTLLLATGRKPIEVAGAMGITQPTLYKHYFNELEQRKSARLRVEGNMLLALAKQATSGNVGAAKRLLDRLDKAALGNAAPAQQAKQSKADPVGKKEQQRQRAYEAGKNSEWGELTTH